MAHLAVIFHRLGPYHHARLKAAGMLGRVTAIELSEQDDTYAWDRVAGAECFRRVTLFKDKGLCDQTTAALVRRLAEILDNVKPDVVAIPGWSASGSLVALSWCVRSGTPAVLMSDSTARDEPRHRWKEGIKGRVVRLFSAALVGGAPHVDYLACLGFARGRITTGYDVVDNAFFSSGADAARRGATAIRERLGLPDRYFLASNRFIEKKNLAALLNAYACYREDAMDESWKLVMLGDGPLRSGLTDLSRALGLSEEVFFPGFKQYPELPAYYGLADAFVHASTTEQWGLVVNEAMAAGLPVLVSSHCGCASDLVRDGRNGYTFDPLQPETLATAMATVSTNWPGREAMGRESREIIKKWSPEYFATSLWESVRVALEVPTPRPASVDHALLWGLIRR